MKNDFLQFIENANIQINHPTQGIIKYVPYDYHLNLFEHIENNRFTILKKFRQGGFTTFLVLYGVYLASIKNKKVIVLSKTDRECDNMSRIVQMMYCNLDQTIYKTRYARRVEYNNGGILYFKTPDGCRGMSADCLILDEVAFWNDMSNITWAMLWPCIKDKVILCSTTNGFNWFYDMYQNALEDKNHFTIFETNYKLCPHWNNEEEWKEKIGDRVWRQEVLSEFLEEEKEYKSTKDILVLTVNIGNLPPPKVEPFLKQCVENIKDLKARYNIIAVPIREGITKIEIYNNVSGKVEPTVFEQLKKAGFKAPRKKKNV